MTRRGLITGSLLVCFTAVLTVIALGLSGPVVPDAVRATSKTPAQHCTSHDAATLHALRQGTISALVVVQAYQPAEPPVAELAVALLSADKKRRHPVARFALRSRQVFTTQEPAKRQRFLIPLSGHAARIEDGKPLCFEVGFDVAPGTVAGGLAEFDIELVDMAATLAR